MYLLPIIALEKVSHNRDIQLLFGLKKRSIGHEALLLLLTKVVLYRFYEIHTSWLASCNRKLCLEDFYESTTFHFR